VINNDYELPEYAEEILSEYGMKKPNVQFEDGEDSDAE
jgi:hypothetical protein